MARFRTTPKSTLNRPERPMPEERGCDWPGCKAVGEFRAPKSRDRLYDYYWFCLEHVRSYNASWNYYEGMSESEIEGEIQNDVTWRRPTWKLGSGAKRRAQPDFTIKDGFGVFEDEEADAKGPPPGMDDPGLTMEERQALATLNLEWPLTKDVLKNRYKELSKRYHPDATGGDKDAEEKFKVISAAYTTVVRALDGFGD